MEEKKVFLRIGAVVSSLEGEISHDKDIKKAWVVPILSESDVIKLPSNDSEKNEWAIKIDLERSVDQYVNPIEDEESKIEWCDIEIEGAGVDSGGDRVYHPSPIQDKIILNYFGEKWPHGFLIGVLSLSEKFFKDHETTIERLSKWPPKGLTPYQALSVLYKDGRRYIGFEAEILSWSSNREVVNLRIYKKEPVGVQVYRAAINIYSLDECDWNIDIKSVRGNAVDLLSSNSNVGSRGGVFFSAKKAAQLQLFIDPKTPFYAGALPSVAGIKPAMIEALPGQGVNIAHHQAELDQTLNAVMLKLYDDREVRITDRKSFSQQQQRTEQLPEALKKFLSSTSTAPESRSPSVSIDFIGHSLKGILHIGQWKISAEEEETKANFKEIVPLLIEHKISEIRFLGCSTASQEAAGNMREIQQMVDGLAGSRKILVLGISRMVGASDFLPKGLKRSAEISLFSADEMLSAPSEERLFNQFWSEAEGISSSSSKTSNMFPSLLLEKETAEQIILASSLYGDAYKFFLTEKMPLHEYLLDEGPKQIPGLLQLPECEVVFSIDENRYNRVTILFEGRLVRIYPAGNSEGLLFRVEDSKRTELLSSIRELPIFSI